MAFLPIQFRGAPLLVIREARDCNFSLQTKSAQILLAVRYIQPLNGAVPIVGRLCVCYNSLPPLLCGRKLALCLRSFLRAWV